MLNVTIIRLNKTLAVVEKLKKFRSYLLGISFTVVTDCNSLKQSATLLGGGCSCLNFHFQSNIAWFSNVAYQRIESKFDRLRKFVKLKFMIGFFQVS